MDPSPPSAAALSTLCSRGPRPEPPSEDGNHPLSPPIVRATTWAAADPERHAALFLERRPTFYQRFGSPAEARLEGFLAELEGGEEAVVFASGMAAVSTTLVAHLRAGSHLVAGSAIFEQTERLMRTLLVEMGVEVSFVDSRRVEAVAEVMRPSTRVVYVETPSNPRLHVSDVAAIAAIAKVAGAFLVVDGTFAGPALSRPLALGASLVVHSLTKSINGHSDAMGGVVIGSRADLAPIRHWKTLLGGVLDAEACWLIERGARTLPLRAERSSASALALAGRLAAHPAVEETRYPFLPADEGYAAARRQMSGGGSVVCFRLRGGVEASRRALGRLRLVPVATSLGGVESVIELPYDLDWAGDGTPAGERGFIRLSVGLESVEELWADLEQAITT